MTKKYKIKKEYLREDGCFNSGGGVPEEELPWYKRPEGATTPLQDIKSGIKSVFSSVLPDVPQQVATAPQPMPASAPMPVGAPIEPVSAQQPMPQQLAAAPQQMQNPYMGEAMVQSRIAQNQANIYDNAIKEQEKLQQDFQARTAEIDRQRQEVAQALDADPVNAQRYVQSKSGLGKASTAIGLILGGIGGGLTGQGNPALDFLNKQIERDIEAQKEGRRGKENLLSQLEKQYGNERDAVTALSGILATRTANQVTQAALKDGGPLAIERAKQATATLMAPHIKSQQELAMQKFANDLYAQGKNPMDYGLPVDEKMQKRAVPGYGLANDPELASKLNSEVLPQHESSMQALAQLKTMGRTVNPVERSKAEQLQQILIGRTRLALLGPGAITDAEREIAKSVIANPTAIFQLAAGDKLVQLESMLNKDFEARVKGAGLKMPQKAKPAAAQQIKSFKPAK